MEEKNRSMTDEALSQQLRRHRSGKLTGRLLSLVGVVIAVAGMVLGGNIVPVIRWGRRYREKPENRRGSRPSGRSRRMR